MQFDTFIFISAVRSKAWGFQLNKNFKNSFLFSFGLFSIN